MVKLTALKPHRYGTRALTAGEVYEARPRDAKLLIAIKRSAPAPEQPIAAAPAPVITPDPQAAQRTLDEFRAEAEALGIAVDRRWGARRLEQEIEAARS